jgi:hypothetical protein
MAYPYPNILGLGQNTPFDRFINAIVGQVSSTVAATTAPLTGVGAPEGVVTATPGRWYVDTGTNNIYLKVSGTGNLGWL